MRRKLRWLIEGAKRRPLLLSCSVLFVALFGLSCAALAPVREVVLTLDADRLGGRTRVGGGAALTLGTTEPCP